MYFHKIIKNIIRILLTSLINLNDLYYNKKLVYSKQEINKMISSIVLNINNISSINDFTRGINSKYNHLLNSTNNIFLTQFNQLLNNTNQDSLTYNKTSVYSRKEIDTLLKQQLDIVLSKNQIDLQTEFYKNNLLINDKIERVVFLLNNKSYINLYSDNTFVKQQRYDSIKFKNNGLINSTLSIISNINKEFSKNDNIYYTKKEVYNKTDVNNKISKVVNLINDKTYNDIYYSNKVMVTDNNNKPITSNITTQQLNFLSEVTSSIQVQLTDIYSQLNNSSTIYDDMFFLTSSNVSVTRARGSTDSSTGETYFEYPSNNQFLLKLKPQFASFGNKIFLGLAIRRDSVDLYGNTFDFNNNEWSIMMKYNYEYADPSDSIGLTLNLDSTDIVWTDNASEYSDRLNVYQIIFKTYNADDPARPLVITNNSSITSIYGKHGTVPPVDINYTNQDIYMQVSRLLNGKTSVCFYNQHLTLLYELHINDIIQYTNDLVISYYWNRYKGIVKGISMSRGRIFSISEAANSINHSSKLSKILPLFQAQTGF
jgi:hypothetical protein